MKAIIIAGGAGTRLRPLTYHRPKPLAPILNRPMIVHQIESLKKHGVTEIVCCLQYLAEQIKAYLGDGRRFGVKIEYAVEEKPLGTAGGVKNAARYFPREPFLVLNGDILTDCDIGRLVAYHRQKQAVATLFLVEVADPSPYGLVLLDGSGAIQRFIEKPTGGEARQARSINAGIYVLDPAVFDRVPDGREFSFERQVFPDLLARQEKFFGYVAANYWLDIGTPAKYLLAHQDALSGRLKIGFDGREVQPRVWAGAGVEVPAGVSCHGPVLLGAGCRLAPGCRIEEFTVLAEEVTVGPDCLVRGSVIWEKTILEKKVVVRDSVIGAACRLEESAQLGAGAVLASGSRVERGSKLGA